MWKKTHDIGLLSPELEGEEVTVNGWVHALRVKGKIAFLVIRDATGTVQATALKKNSEEVFETLKDLPRESAIAVTGKIKIHPEAPGGFEIIPSRLEILNRAETPLPFDPFADYINTNKDTRFDWRILDLRNPKTLAYHQLRSAVIFEVSNYMMKEGFTFWSTPKVLGAASEGGAEVFNVDWFGKPAFLAMSPQLHKQAIAANTGTKFFEITPYFRAEKSRTRRHLAEFSGFDVEVPFATDEDVWTYMEGIVKTASEAVRKHPKLLELLGVEVPEVKTPFKRVSYDECVDLLNKNGMEMEWGEDFSTEQEAKLWELINEPFIIYQFPRSVGKFYVRGVEDDDSKCHAFDLIYKHELSSGGWREHRYDKLLENIKSKGLNPESFESYLNFFKYGAAPHSGFGMGIERLVATLLSAPDVREVVAFPRTVDRLHP